MRETDAVARLGGDEFVILFPNTDGKRAKKPLRKIHGQLQQAMDRYRWPITFSIGVLTCFAPSATIEDIIREADHVMYDSKKMGKDAVRYATYGLIAQNS